MSWIEDTHHEFFTLIIPKAQIPSFALSTNVIFSNKNDSRFVYVPNMLQQTTSKIHHFIAPTPYITSVIHSALSELVIGTTKKKKTTIIQQSNTRHENPQSFALDNLSLLPHFPTTPLILFLPRPSKLKLHTCLFILNHSRPK